jgi:hypothetical protein
VEEEEEIHRGEAEERSNDLIDQERSENVPRSLHSETAKYTASPVGMTKQ